MVRSDHGVVIVALPERGGLADVARRAQEALDSAFDDDGRATIGYSSAHEHPRDAHRAQSPRPV